MLAATGIHMDAADSRDLYCGFSIKVANKEHLQCLQKTQLGFKSKCIKTKQKKSGTSRIKCHLLEYSKLYHGFKSVPRKKGHFLKKFFLPIHYLGEQPQKCSNLEQMSLETGESRLLDAEQIRKRTKQKVQFQVCSPISSLNTTINTLTSRNTRLKTFRGGEIRGKTYFDLKKKKVKK